MRYPSWAQEEHSSVLRRFIVYRQTISNVA